MIDHEAIEERKAILAADGIEYIDKETGEVTKPTCDAIKRLEAHRAKVIQDKQNKWGRK